MRRFAAFLLTACCFFTIPLATTAKSDTEYTVFLSNLPAEIAEGITPGEKVTDAAGKGAAGVVLSAAILPHKEEYYSPESQALQIVVVPHRADVLLRIRGEVSRKNGVLYAGTLPLQKGATVFLHLPHFCGEGILVEIME